MSMLLDVDSGRRRVQRVTVGPHRPLQPPPTTVLAPLLYMPCLLLEVDRSYHCSLSIAFNEKQKSILHIHSHLVSTNSVALPHPAETWGRQWTTAT